MATLFSGSLARDVSEPFRLKPLSAYSRSRGLRGVQGEYFSLKAIDMKVALPSFFLFLYGDTEKAA